MAQIPSTLGGQEFPESWLTGRSLNDINSQTPPGIPTPSSTNTSGTRSTSSQQRSQSSSSGLIPPSAKKMFEIKEKLLRPALTSHYECWFNPPGKDNTKFRDFLNQKGFNYTTEIAKLLSFSCSEASLPGSSMMTNEINDDHTGVTERHAYRRQYDDRADFTFYVDHGRSDGNYNVLMFFEYWLAYIAGEELAEGLEYNNYFYRVNYPSVYQTTIYLNKFERDMQGKYLEYRFLQAYPISITSMPVSYDSSQLLKCTVSFTYTRYVTTRKIHRPTQEEIERAIDAGAEAAYGYTGGYLIANDLIGRNQSSGGNTNIDNRSTSTVLSQQQILQRRRGF